MAEAELAKLFTAFGYFVFRRALVFLGEPVAAQTIVVDTFVEFGRSGPLQGDPFRNLCRIADRRCSAVLRQATAPVPASDSAIADAVGDDGCDALLTVRRLLCETEPESLRLAVLYYVDELTEEELARELALPRRTVKKRVSALLGRARALLRQEHAS